ncbi:MAG: hypothetical protein RMK29_14850 [Myxococcales bacterium]|nr:hypothetical protein [Myxococcales bacterium]
MAFSSVPSQIGPFRVCDVLCTTLAGALVRVEDVQGGGRQTLMLLDPDEAGWPARLRQQHRLSSHPRLCRLAPGGPGRLEGADRAYYYVGTEPLCGWTVLDEVAREGRIAPLERAVRLGAEAAEALAHAHQQGLAHGHLEPGCLFIQTYAEEDEGHIKLLGVGLQVVARPASRAARYRPWPGPVARSHRARFAQDVAALGGVLSYMITGQVPDHRDPARALQAACTPPALMEVVLRAMSTAPRRRFASAAALHQALLEVDLSPPAGRPRAPSLWQPRQRAQA